MSEINTFKDWWYAYSEELFQQAKKTGDWWAEFEKCWEAAQTLELQRCANLSANRLALEAQVSRACANGGLQEFLKLQEALEKTTGASNE
jgi:hypothetical protein